MRRLQLWTKELLELLDVKPAAALTDDKVPDLLAATRLVTLRMPAAVPRALSVNFGRRVVSLVNGLEPQFAPELLNAIQRRAADDARLRMTSQDDADRVFRHYRNGATCSGAIPCSPRGSNQRLAPWLYGRMTANQEPLSGSS